MEQSNAKIHLKAGDIEFSIEGSPDYVNKQYTQIAKDLNLQEKLGISSKQEEKAKPKKVSQTSKSKTSTSKEELKEKAKEDFGEWLKNLPKGLKNRDNILVAGYFNQLRSKEHTFRVRDMNNTLKNQGITISNPSSLINNLLKTQNVLKQVSREGRQKYYQLTKEGEKYIRDLLEAKNK